MCHCEGKKGNSGILFWNKRLSGSLWKLESSEIKIL